MATLERVEAVLDRAAPSWGIRPVPDRLRRLSGLDLAVLWGDLSVGLLVLVTGALLVPALGLRLALFAIVLGTALGCLPLALVGRAGQREGVSTMVLFRPVLGARGSYLPSILNLAQLLGWTAVEFWAMGRVANAVSMGAGVDAFPLWVVVAAVVCAALAIGGPVLVVRAWLARFGVWVLLAAGAVITFRLLTSGALADLWDRPGTGGFPFWAAVDLAIVMPISWLPLVADYNRFARRDARGFAGTYLGYAAGNIWFYTLGALLVLVSGAAPDIVGIGTGVLAVGGGLIVLVMLLVGETDEAFANLYSGAVSAQNLFPKLRQRAFIIGLAAVAALLALVVDMQKYEVFLFLIGSVFVPLFGVFLASYVVHRQRGYDERNLFDAAGAARSRGGIRWRAILAWIAGFVVYHWCAPLAPEGWMGGVQTVLGGWLGLPFPLFGGAIGASIPGFLAAFGAGALFLIPPRNRRAGEPSPQESRPGPPRRSGV